MTSHPPKRKRSVEIYFILYLAALILLIPQKDEKKGNKNGSDSDLDYGFSLKADKSILNCNFTVDSMGITAISMDTTNKIFFSGDVYNVNFSFEIVDQNFLQKIVVSRNEQPSRFFRFEELPNEKCALFHWQPPLKDISNNSYLVNVTATAKKMIDSKTERTVTAKTQFNLNIIFSSSTSNFARIDTVKNQVPLMLDQGGNNSVNAVMPLTTNFFIKPRDNTIIRFQHDKWQNFIDIYGLNSKNDLKEQPMLTVSHQSDECGGWAKIQSISGQNVEIIGEVPACGKIKVKLTLKRVDGLAAETEFDVIPQLFEDPVYPKIAFPGVKYKIDPKMPLLTGQQSKARIVTKAGKNVYASSLNGEVINFTPSINDTGKVLLLERYIDSNLLQQTYQINVKNFPAPEIVDLKPNPPYIRIMTQSYGLFNNGENMVVSIEFSRGSNAYSQTIAGKTNFDNEKFVCYQEFDILPKNSSKPFQFKLTLVSENGQRSRIFSYPTER